MGMAAIGKPDLNLRVSFADHKEVRHDQKTAYSLAYLS